jgi:hypothetical protein
MATPGFYVYVLFRENGLPFYIGKGSNGRWLRHEKDARGSAKGRRFSIIRRMLARGVEAPKIKLHEDLTADMALQYEIALIAAIGRHPHGPLVNLTDGGDGCLNPSLETRARFAANARARFAGRKRSPESIAKMAVTNTGRKRSPEARAKLQEAALRRGAKMRGKKQTPELIAKRTAGQRGRKHTPEAIAKMRGRKPTPEHVTKMREATIGLKRSPEAREKMRQAALRRLEIPEGRENVRQAGLASWEKNKRLPIT